MHFTASVTLFIAINKPLMVECFNQFPKKCLTRNALLDYADNISSTRRYSLTLSREFTDNSLKVASLVFNAQFEGLKKINANPDIYTINDFLGKEVCESLISTFKLVSATCPENLDRSRSPKLQLDYSLILRVMIPLLTLTSSLLTYVAVCGSNDIMEINTLQIFKLFVIQFIKCFVFVGGTISTALHLYSYHEEIKIVYDDKNSHRSSWMMQLGANCPYAIDITSNIVSKVKTLLCTNENTFERPTLTRYQQGQSFKVHNDASMDIKLDGWDQLGGHRMATVIIYLNNVEHGGGTYFDKLDIRIKPKQGSALLFFPADFETGKVDILTSHCGEPPLNEKDEKYIIQIWKRERMVPSPLGYVTSSSTLIPNKGNGNIMGG